ncbi:MAG TPA: hypothetical protein VIG24_04605, partial [Acidimicrobiia bacterium]
IDLRGKPLSRRHPTLQELEKRLLLTLSTPQRGSRIRDLLRVARRLRRDLLAAVRVAVAAVVRLRRARLTPAVSCRSVRFASLLRVGW